LKNHFYGTKPFCYKTFKTSEKLSRNYEILHKEHVLPLIENGLMGTIYTELSDVEDEINGLYTFDRKVLKINKTTIQEINKIIDIWMSKIDS